MEGKIDLTGNINLVTALKAYEDIILNGEVKNTDNSVLFSKYGDIIIDSQNVNLNGLVYAPFGTVEITAQNMNLNNVVIIAQEIIVTSPNVNANYSDTAAAFAGNVSEALNITLDEWKYLKDMDEDGIPDFFEDRNNWEKLLDIDGDGLPDCIEQYLGTDPEASDTDGDGLDDQFELFYSATDPTLWDTDENGIGDGDEDLDADGLTNFEEQLLRTYPYIEDSDEDGLPDGEEVQVYGTDPLKADTDGDGLDDADELYLGTDPLKPDTNGNGILDGKEKFAQTMSYCVNSEACAIEEVRVSMECTGNITKTTSIKSIMDEDVLCTNVVGLVGEPFEIESSSEFEKAVLTFKINPSKLNGTDFDSLLFLWYDEEHYEFVELDTAYDEENSLVSIETTHFSKYMIVDKYLWFAAWAVELNYNPNGSTSTINNTVLAIDCSGSMSSNDPITVISGTDARFPKICQRIIAATAFINAMGAGDKAAVVLFQSSASLAAGMTDDTQVLLEALQKVSNSGNTSFIAALNTAVAAFSEEDLKADNVNNRIILLSDGNAIVSPGTIQACTEKNIAVYPIGLGSGVEEVVLSHIADSTGGKYFSADTANDLLDIYSELGMTAGDFDTTDSDGDGLYDAVETAGIRIQNGCIIYTNPDNADTDGDGLLDGMEILDTPRLHLNDLLKEQLSSKKPFFFPLIADPNSKDSDGDGYPDYDELVIYGSNPYLNEIEIYHLKYDYFSVWYEGNRGWDNHISDEVWSYGGSQMWFDGQGEPEDSRYEYFIEHNGCGLIAGADLLLYLALSDGAYRTRQTDMVQLDPFEYVDYFSYIEYIKNMGRKYFSIIPYVGVLGTDIASGINAYSRINGLNLNAKWGVSERKILPDIIEMLKSNIPVPLSVFIGLHKNSFNNSFVSCLNDYSAVRLYDLKEKQDDPYYFSVSGSRTMRGHYANVTQVILNGVKNEVYLKVSSWGQSYYIDFDEFRKYVAFNDSYLFCNIVYIGGK